MDFKEFDKQVDIEQLKNDAAEIKKNGGTGDFPELPAGIYIIKLDKLELGTTKDKRPMMKGQFSIVEGEYKKRKIFVNRVVYGTKNDANMIANVLSFLESLAPSEDVGPLVFTGYAALAELIMDVAEDVADLTYEAEYDADAFNPISIKEVFEEE